MVVLKTNAWNHTHAIPYLLTTPRWLRNTDIEDGNTITVQWDTVHIPFLPLLRALVRLGVDVVTWGLLMWTGVKERRRELTRFVGGGWECCTGCHLSWVVSEVVSWQGGGVTYLGSPTLTLWA